MREYNVEGQADKLSDVEAQLMQLLNELAAKKEAQGLITIRIKSHIAGVEPFESDLLVNFSQQNLKIWHCNLDLRPAMRPLKNTIQKFVEYHRPNEPFENYFDDLFRIEREPLLHATLQEGGEYRPMPGESKEAYARELLLKAYKSDSLSRQAHTGIWSSLFNHTGSAKHPEEYVAERSAGVTRRK